MDTKRNLKYFLAKGLSLSLYISLGLLAVGLFLAIVSGHNMTLLMVGILLVLVALCVMIFSSGSKANEVDIDNICMEMTKDLVELATKKFEVYERSYLRMIKPISLSGYEFSDDPSLLTKKASDNKLRSNIFAGVYMFFTNDNAYIYRRRFSVTDESVLADDYHKIPYAKLVAASIDTKDFPYTHGKKDLIYANNMLVITTTEGEVLRLCVEEGADVDKAVADINHLIDIKHKNPEDRLATEGGKYQTNR